MQVSQIMARDVRVADPDLAIRDAAVMMADLDIGSLPVSENDRLVGMITDRDIVVRAVADGKGPDTRVRDVMTSDVRYCFEDEDVDHVAQNMGEQQIRRLPVVDRNKRMVGIVSLSDLAVGTNNDDAGVALSGISRRGGNHNNSWTGDSTAGTT